MLDLLSELDKNPEISLFKFADDATIKISGHSNQQCIDTLKQVAASLYEWSRKWRMIINCDPNKTEYICFRSNSADIPIPDTINIGPKEIKRVEQTKVLGLTMDEKLSFIPHGQDIYKRLLGKWGQICVYSNKNWGFNQKVLVRIIETLFVSIIQYAGHIYLNTKTLEIINKIWYKVLKSTIGATFNIMQENAEIILGLPPLKVQTSINRTKHYLKLNITKTQSDCLQDTLSNCLNGRNPPKEVKDGMKEVFKFLKWKISKSPQDFNEEDSRIISNNLLNYFDQLSIKSCSYTKSSIRKYTELIWSNISNNQQIMNGELVLAKPQRSPIPVPTHTDRKEEVLLLSLFYPNNLMNSFVYRHTFNAESPLCPRCNSKEQTAYHVIMECNSHLQKIQAITQKILGEEAAQVDHHNTLLNCSRNSEFIQCALEILASGNFRYHIDGIIPARAN